MGRATVQIELSEFSTDRDVREAIPAAMDWNEVLNRRQRPRDGADMRQGIRASMTSLSRDEGHADPKIARWMNAAIDNAVYRCAHLEKVRKGEASTEVPKDFLHQEYERTRRYLLAWFEVFLFRNTGRGGKSRMEKDCVEALGFEPGSCPTLEEFAQRAIQRVLDGEKPFKRPLVTADKVRKRIDK